ncbi:MAG: hypothetical protein A2Z01_05820 [Betaproteobacteria bacterium RBG_16_58_11]|nr:MAG: hypothetical protein A2Z01_05820 [Betaproteobacteria bacterium RBG_16_58_11]
MIMLNNERRSSDDRRKADGFNTHSPFLTKDGLVFTNRRKNADRRDLKMEEIFELGEVEEIELKPVRCT